jgi:hypothetical protein
MHKTHLLSLTAASLAALISASAGADANLEKYEVLLKASVPADEFQVRPVESGWILERQEMAYDFGTEQLKPVNKMFQYKNTAGAIKATLMNTDTNGAPVLFGGNGKSIPLSVKFNNIAVTAQGVQVVTADEAKNGGRTDLDISTVNNTALSPATWAGEYTGSVSINFEPVVTGS